MESPDHPEPHPGDPWHPDWRPDGEAAASDEPVTDAATVDDDPGDTPEQAADAEPEMRRDVAALQQAAPRVSPSDGSPVPESGVVPPRGWFRRRRRREEQYEAEDVATADEEGLRDVDDLEQNQDDAPDVVDTDDAGNADDTPDSETPTSEGADEAWVAELTAAAEPAEDEDVYASLAPGSGDDDDFPWDDEDWSTATSGEDAAAAPLDLVADDTDDADVADDVDDADDADVADDTDVADDVDDANDTDDTDVADVPGDADVSGDADATDVADDASVSGDADDADDADDASVSGDAGDAGVTDLAGDADEVAGDTDDVGAEDSDDVTLETAGADVTEEAEGDGGGMDRLDEAEGRYSHADVIPLVRPGSIGDEDASAGIDPDLVAVAEADADEPADAGTPNEDDDAAATDDAEDLGGAEDVGVADEASSGDDDASDDEEEGFAPFSIDDYTGTATEEYAALAREVAASEGTMPEPAAVSAEMPGIDTSLVSLDDVVEAGIGVTETLSTTRRSDLGLRVATGIGLLLVFLGSLLWPWAIGMLILVVLATAALEFYIVAVNSGHRPLTWAGLVGVVGILVGTWVWGVVAVPVALGLTLIGSILFLAMSAPRRVPLVDIALTITGVAWIGVLGAPAFVIIEAPEYRWLILAIVLTTAVMDVAQYFAGRWLGRRPLAPVVSPRKTLEGLVGGVFAALVVGVAFGSIEGSPFDPGSGLAFGAMVAVVAPFGDLAVSVVKRALDVKDMSGILPGHGGVLDRIDAMIFVIPSAWILYRFFELVG